MAKSKKTITLTNVEKNISTAIKQLEGDIRREGIIDLANINILDYHPFTSKDTAKITNQIIDVYQEGAEKLKDLDKLKRSLTRTLNSKITSDDFLVKLCWENITLINFNDKKSLKKGLVPVSRTRSTLQSESYLVYNPKTRKIKFDTNVPYMEMSSKENQVTVKPTVRSASTQRGLTVPAIKPIVGEIDGYNSWYAIYSLNKYRNFTGRVMHIHLQDPGWIDDFICQILDIISNLNIPYASLAAQIIGINLECAVNSDGTYDMFAYKGQRKILWFEVPFFYAGFVSDKPLIPPVRFSILQPGIIGIFPIASLITGYWVKWLSAPFRNEPSPAAVPQHYLANKNPNSMEVHIDSCYWAGKIAKNHRVKYESLEEAFADHYDGCYYCLNYFHTR